MTTTTARQYICTECDEPVQNIPPTTWCGAWGQAPDFSHLDGEPLCPVMTADGYRPALPEEVTPEPVAVVIPDYQITAVRDLIEQATTGTPDERHYAAMQLVGCMAFLVNIDPEFLPKAGA